MNERQVLSPEQYDLEVQRQLLLSKIQVLQDQIEIAKSQADKVKLESDKRILELRVKVLEMKPVTRAERPLNRPGAVPQEDVQLQIVAHESLFASVGDRTDCEKTLKALREAGEKGVHSFDLNHIVGTSRSAARVNDLKNEGHHIISVPEIKGGSRGVRYYLREV